MTRISCALATLAALTCVATAQAETPQNATGDLEAVARSLVGTLNTPATTLDTTTTQNVPATTADPQTTASLAAPETAPDLAKAGDFSFPTNAAALAAFIASRRAKTPQPDPRDEACVIARELNPNAKNPADCLGR